MNKLESVILNSAVSYFSNYINHEKKNYVIEPLTCMIRLAILAFKPKGTKICIYDNSIYIQEPGYLQGTIRWISGNNRNDIHYLLSPINKAIVRFGNKLRTDPNIHNDIMNIFKLTIKGLLILKKSYLKHSNGNLTTHSIDLYINKIKNCIDGIEDSSEEEYDESDKSYNHLNGIWTNEQIKLVNNLFIECGKNKDCESYLYAIENIITSKLKPTKDILVKNINNCI
jgi:hypothetical protein